MPKFQACPVVGSRNEAVGVECPRNRGQFYAPCQLGASSIFCRRFFAWISDVCRVFQLNWRDLDNDLETADPSFQKKNPAGWNWCLDFTCSRFLLVVVYSEIFSYPFDFMVNIGIEARHTFLGTFGSPGNNAINCRFSIIITYKRTAWIPCTAISSVVLSK